MKIKTFSIILSAVLWVAATPSFGAAKPAAGAVKSIKIGGHIGARIDDVIKKRVLGEDVESFVNAFRSRQETSRWQTEFWGKWMHSSVPYLGYVTAGKCTVESAKCKVAEELCSKIDHGVDRMLSSQEKGGYIGNYPDELRCGEGWDVWGMKYTLMGLLHYYDLEMRIGTDAALRRAVVEGEIDTISTDHCSFNLHGQKDRGMGDFRKIPNGGPGVEHRPALIATSFADALGPRELLALLSENQARVFGMFPRKGILAVGSDADVCVWDPAQEWTISAATQHQNVDYTTYEGFQCKGRAHLVYVNGELAARDGEPTGAKPGTYVAR